MAARPAAAVSQAEVIDLLSDEDDIQVGAGAPDHDLHVADRVPLVLDENGNLLPANELPFDFFDAIVHPGQAPLLPDNPPVRGQLMVINGEEVFIPDEEAPRPYTAPPAAPPKDAPFTVDTCLQRVLEIFPDISHDYVHELYNEFDASDEYEVLPGSARLDNIIENLLSNLDYPRYAKGKQAVRKRKRGDSIDETNANRWTVESRELAPSFLKGSIQAMLKAEYPDIPVRFINDTLARDKHFYQAYITLAISRDSNDPARPTFSRGRPPKNHELASADVIAANCGWPTLTEELVAARKRAAVLRAERAAEDAMKTSEQENLRHAMEQGETAECQACFEELPMNRQIHCDGAVAHFTCYECLETYIKTEIGDARCNVLCTAGCGSGFAPGQLNQLGNPQLLKKLADLEQEKAIRDAGLDDLEECPFCDFKAIMPPIDEDFEFRCANPECEKVSCRRCKSISHIPASCEQHAKDNKLSSRHKIEEAMTAALVRSCNKCKKQFIKEYGCNKMTCPSCMNIQCYVCSETVQNYDHFDQQHNPLVDRPAPERCPLYDNVEERHEREVREAEEAARKALLEANPNLTEQDVEINVSDAVKQATADRVRRGAAAGGYGMNMLYPANNILGGAQLFDGVADDVRIPNEGLLNLAARRRQDALRANLLHRAAERRARQVANARNHPFNLAPALVRDEAVQPAAAQHVHQYHPPGRPIPGGLAGYMAAFGLRGGPPPLPELQLPVEWVNEDMPQAAPAAPLGPAGLRIPHARARHNVVPPAPAPATPPAPPPAPAPTPGPAPDVLGYFEHPFDPIANGGIDPLQRPANNQRESYVRQHMQRPNPHAAEAGAERHGTVDLPDVRQQRENFEHLEALRTLHNRLLRERQMGMGLHTEVIRDATRASRAEQVEAHRLEILRRRQAAADRATADALHRQSHVARGAFHGP
ncbi:hypothetical protein BAUCODRAFT_299630 [Baudoinia panamericana UAMH 10762]|uniref:RING-type domain-containing protein n=1 Tax=Baudoinia panamericana (strain UAMH 10762) TaxID=717646 RepID=M2MZ85_BAUPA|nr:uncharacterized protein BAUCODRAFT_299630 [Baudoinia panamericana UAMH 10762]EMC91635.1 hypothetical protein BAUCODRAFT_299630 [Baudoinia panamericana UAMH 10762]